MKLNSIIYKLKARAVQFGACGSSLWLIVFGPLPMHKFWSCLKTCWVWSEGGNQDKTWPDYPVVPLNWPMLHHVLQKLCDPADRQKWKQFLIPAGMAEAKNDDNDFTGIISETLEIENKVAILLFCISPGIFFSLGNTNSWSHCKRSTPSLAKILLLSIKHHFSSVNHNQTLLLVNASPVEMSSIIFSFIEINNVLENYGHFGLKVDTVTWRYYFQTCCHSHSRYPMHETTQVFKKKQTPFFPFKYEVCFFLN